MITMPYEIYCYSEHYDYDRMVIANTDGHVRRIRTCDLCAEMDDHPYLECFTSVTF